MQQIRSIGIVSTARIMAVVYGLFSLLFMPFLLLAALAGAASGDSTLAGLGMAAVVVLAVLLPLIYAALGFLAGAIGAFIYNLAARWAGGIEITLSDAGPAVAHVAGGAGR
jgi:uncharacterized membrane protein